MDDPLPPQYQGEECIGHGAYGEVRSAPDPLQPTVTIYCIHRIQWSQVSKAYDTQRKAHVAIKRIYSNPVTSSYWGGTSLGCTEADALSQLRHDHVLTMHDVIRYAQPRPTNTHLPSSSQATVLHAAGAGARRRRPRHIPRRHAATTCAPTRQAHHATHFPRPRGMPCTWYACTPATPTTHACASTPTRRAASGPQAKQRARGAGLLEVGRLWSKPS